MGSVSDACGANNSVQAPPTDQAQRGSVVSDEILLVRAFLSRVAEPASIPIWAMVLRDGPRAAAEQLRAGRVGKRRSEAIALRVARADPQQDLEVAQRHGIRLIVPESDEWPHFAMAALEAAGLRRLARYEQGETEQSERGEPIPPLALWVRGTAELAAVGTRSVSIVGSRAATEYGNWFATDLASRLAGRGFEVVSGGAHGIDSAAHRGALSVGGQTVLVSAAGLDRPYPPGNDRLFDRVADSGLLISESPPGSAPARRRFLTRNRLIAALGTGTVVVEAAARSGAMNTAGHCTELGRPLMAVPGPVTSTMSVGCHILLRAEQRSATLVTGAADVLELIGSARDLPPPKTAPADGADLSSRLDRLGPVERQVFDGFPARSWIGADGLAAVTGLSPLAVIRALPALELSGLVESSSQGHRIAESARTPPGGIGGGSQTGDSTRAPAI